MDVCSRRYHNSSNDMVSSSAATRANPRYYTIIKLKRASGEQQEMHRCMIYQQHQSCEHKMSSPLTCCSCCGLPVMRSASAATAAPLPLHRSYTLSKICLFVCRSVFALTRFRTSRRMDQYLETPEAGHSWHKGMQPCFPNLMTRNVYTAVQYSGDSECYRDTPDSWTSKQSWHQSHYP